MSLTFGTRLGPYEIVGTLGSGGMGDVYRARDTRLGRDVAIKVPPVGVARSEQARFRFEREARVISQLSHPHICALYDVGREGETEYLVMELIEGRTLAERLARGALPLGEVTRYGLEICSALEAAHQKGIVHRDLKPGNVMLTARGVKLLDFGLAKAIAPNSDGEAFDDLETATSARTETGTVMGTLPYMSPEQVQGRPADSRSDVFALGTVLYEMTTGKRPFPAENRAALISAILTSDPAPISEVIPAAPPLLVYVVKTCLAKEPAERWRSAHDVGLQLRAIAEGASGPTASFAVTPARRRWSAIASLALAAAAGATLPFLLSTSMRTSRPPQSPIRFQVPPPAGGSFAFAGEATNLAVSPDGSALAFVAQDAAGELHVYWRPLSAATARPLAGTEGAHSVFFSPDGRSIGFITAKRLSRLALPDGSPVAVCDLPPGRLLWGTWGRGGDILLSNNQRDAIWRVPATGGTPSEVVKSDTSRGEGKLNHPIFLPDGERFLYLSWSTGGQVTLMLAEPGKPPRAIGPIGSFVQYVAPETLAFVRDGALVAQRFDAKGGRLVGPTIPLAARVNWFMPNGSAAFGASQGGTLAYQAQGDVSGLIWYDRSGKEVGPAGPKGTFWRVAIAPDGRRALMDRWRSDVGKMDVWMIDLALGTETHLTSDSTTEMYPVWAPRGTIIYSSDKTAFPRLVVHDLATEKAQPLLPDDPRGFQIAQDVSPDGRFLLYAERRGGPFDIFAVPLAGGETIPFVQSPFDDSEARFSPDGRYVVFESTASGRREAYVTPFPGPGEKTRISKDGASSVRWSRDGREILHISGDGRLMSVPVRTSPSLSVGPPASLFALPPKGWTGFDVTPDGKRFLAIVPEVVGNELPLDVVVNGMPSGDAR